MSAPPVTLAERALRHQLAGELVHAQAIWRHLVVAEPDNALARFYLGTLLGSLGQYAEAETWLAEAVRLAPDLPELLGNLGVVRQRLGRLEDAVVCYRKALTLRHDLLEVHNNLGGALQELGRAEESLAAYRNAGVTDSATAANILTTLNLVPGTRAQFLAEAQDWARRFADPLTPPRANRPRGTRLRIGYVGADGFCRHTLALTWLPLLEAHDTRRVEVFAYSDLPTAREDDISQRFQAVSTWRHTADLDDERLAALIREDRIDVLVDGIGFAAGTRLLAFARRPAPVQVHFPPMSTTGMKAMDYVVGDARLFPESAEADFSETIYRLPCAFLYAPLTDLPPLTPPPATKNGYVTFGSFSRPPKISTTALAAWARILSALPGSHLRIKSGALLTDGTVATLRRGLARHGVAPDRLEFRTRVADDIAHYQELLDIDIALDTFPHGGVLTTCDALTMGVPVVTLTGERVLERYGATLVQEAGFAEGSVTDVDRYVGHAVSLGSDVPRLAALRPQLAASMRGSALCDAPRFTTTLEDAYDAMYRQTAGAPSA
jgi:predicted O-linked N-acetylglucosamine transferase (SPINDLY family)